MNPALWVSLVSPALVLAGAGIAGLMKFGRLVDAVERLERSMSKVAERVDDHEVRLAKGGL